MSYPLFDHLSRLVHQRQDKYIDIKTVCTTINNFSLYMSSTEYLDHYEEISAIILHYDVINNGSMILSPNPYDSKIMPGGRGILNYIINLPPFLQQIIAQYIEYYS